jgi:hypothetical protein
MLTSSSEAALQAHSIREQIEKLSKSGSPELRRTLEKADEGFTALLNGKEKSAGGEEAPGLDEVAGEVSELYTEVGQVDAAPTAAQRTAAEHVSEELSEALRAWGRLKSTAIPELNDKLRNEHLPTLNLDQRPETMPESGDED